MLANIEVESPETPQGLRQSWNLDMQLAWRGILLLFLGALTVRFAMSQGEKRRHTLHQDSVQAFVTAVLASACLGHLHTLLPLNQGPSAVVLLLIRTVT